MLELGRIYRYKTLLGCGYTWCAIAKFIQDETLVEFGYGLLLCVNQQTIITVNEKQLLTEFLGSINFLIKPYIAKDNKGVVSIKRAVYNDIVEGLYNFNGVEYNFVLLEQSCEKEIQ